MIHILCPGCQTVITITDFPCPNCGNCPGCGSRPNSAARECSNCHHPNDEQITQHLVSTGGIPESALDDVRRCADNLQRLWRIHVYSYRIAVVVGIVLTLYIQHERGLSGAIVVLLGAAATFVAIEVVFGVLGFLQRRTIARLRGDN